MGSKAVHRETVGSRVAALEMAVVRMDLYIRDLEDRIYQLEQKKGKIYAVTPGGTWIIEPSEWKGL